MAASWAIGRGYWRIAISWQELPACSTLLRSPWAMQKSLTNSAVHSVFSTRYGHALVTSPTCSLRASKRLALGTLSAITTTNQSVRQLLQKSMTLSLFTSTSSLKLLHPSPLKYVQSSPSSPPAYALQFLAGAELMRAYIISNICKNARDTFPVQVGPGVFGKGYKCMQDPAIMGLLQNPKKPNEDYPRYPPVLYKDGAITGKMHFVV